LNKLKWIKYTIQKQKLGLNFRKTYKTLDDIKLLKEIFKEVQKGDRLLQNTLRFDGGKLIIIEVSSWNWFCSCFRVERSYQQLNPLLYKKVKKTDRVEVETIAELSAGRKGLFKNGTVHSGGTSNFHFNACCPAEIRWL
jgi:hypothetical protein